MKAVTVTRLKASLSHYLRQVKAGEEVLITERGRPVARLVPVGGEVTLSRHLAELERQGLVRMGRGGLPRGFWHLPRPADPEGHVLRAALEERASGW